MRLKKSVSFSVFVMTIALLGLSRFAFSSDRVTLSPDLLRTIESIPNGKDHVRLYVSRKLISYQKLGIGQDQDIQNGNLNLSSGKKLHKDKLKRNRPGKIILTESLGDGNIEKIYVTFDPACKVRQCAFGFTRYKDQRTFSGAYYLDNVPSLPGYKVVQVLSQFGGDIVDISNYGRQLSPIDFLEVKLDELHDVSRSRHNQPGVGAEK